MIDTNLTFCQSEIIEVINLFGKDAENINVRHKFTESEGNHSNCPDIYEDKDIINESEETDKIICVKNNQFYLGTEEEEIEYHNKLVYKVCFYSHKAKVVRNKISQDGQEKLFTYDYVEMEKSQGRNYHEAFVRQQSLLNEVERLKKELQLQKNESKMWKERYEYVKENS